MDEPLQRISKKNRDASEQDHSTSTTGWGKPIMQLPKACLFSKLHIQTLRNPKLDSKSTGGHFTSFGVPYAGFLPTQGNALYVTRELDYTSCDSCQEFRAAIELLSVIVKAVTLEDQNK